MKAKFYVFLGLASIILWNCSSPSDSNQVKVANNSIMKQKDGAISLKLANAECYRDVKNPSDNTAEWKVVISEAGSYRVWISSATKDTVNLNYTNAVKVNFPNKQVDVIPKCDKIVRHSKDVSYPYYRADSYVGSVYFAEPGEYNIEVISEKIALESSKNQTPSLTNSSRLMAVILLPFAN